MYAACRLQLQGSCAVPDPDILGDGYIVGPVKQHLQATTQKQHNSCQNKSLGLESSPLHTIHGKLAAHGTLLGIAKQWP